MEGSGQLQNPAALTRVKIPGTNGIGVRVGPRAGLNVLENRKIYCPSRDSNPGLSYLYPRFYTDYAMPPPETSTRII